MTSEEFGQANDDDSQLEALEPEFYALNDAIDAGEREIDSARARAHEIDVRLDALAERLSDITNEIMETPAAGARGVAVKLRIYRRNVLDMEARGCVRAGLDLIDRDEPAEFDTPERFAVYALADLERLAGGCAMNKPQKSKVIEAGAVPPGDGLKWTRALRLARQKALKARRKIGGDPSRARQLLWQWARQDKALKEAIFRVGCHHLTMGAAAPQPEPAGGAA